MRTFHHFPTLLLLLFVQITAASAQPVPSDLRCEGLDNPLAIDNTQPHFSWKVRTDTPFPQTAYEIEVASSPRLLEEGKADMWTSGQIHSDESVFVAYGGKPLCPRSLYYWRIRTHSGQRTTSWSPTQRFGIGIIAPDVMRGQFIGMGWGQQKAVILIRSFKVRSVDIDAALLHVNSLGYHEVYVNGKKVSESVLTPAVSQMDKRSLIVTYDIAPLLRKGSNTLAIWIASGWYKKDTFHAGYDGPLVRADLDIVHNSKTFPLLCTDSQWMGCESGYEDSGSWRAHNFGCEHIDARLVPDLTDEGFRDISWSHVETIRIDTLSAMPQMCELTICKEELTPVSIEPMEANTWLVDMGRIVNGMLDVQLPSLPAGHEVRAVYAEKLTPDDKPVFIQGTDIFVSSGKPSGDTFCNRFNHRPFRYIIFSNLPSRPDSHLIRVKRIGYDAEQTGTFRCSDEDLNSIHRLLSYTMDNLTFSGYMVDCIGRERLGYGGDGNASTLSLQNNFDVAPLFLNWLTAWNDATRPDGSVPHTAPCPYPAGGGPYWCSFVVQAPWRTWWNFGDDRMLERGYSTMKLWLNYVDSYTQEGLLQRWPDTSFRIWYLGDWLTPEGTDASLTESVLLANNCALSQSYADLEQIAHHLKHYDDEKEFVRRRQSLNNLIHATFFNPSDSTYAHGSQLDLAYPLLVGAVPEEFIPVVTKKLIQARTHIGVGLVGVPVLTEWATRSHQADFFYTLLKQPDYPGYLHMLRNGATGTWEDWGNPSSFLHNCYNGADSWFYQALGGIIPSSPGYKTVFIDPQAPRGLEWVRVSRETPYGTILVHWQRDAEGEKTSGSGETISVHVEIPNGITATIPDGTILTAGRHDFRLTLKETPF